MNEEPTPEVSDGSDTQRSLVDLADSDLPSKSCDGALAQAFEFLGKRWNGVILGTLTNGTSGFAELRRNVAGISDSMLSERLSELQAAGLVLRSVDPGPPVSVSYRLSDTGAALIPAMHALSEWAVNNIPSGDQVAAAPNGPKTA